MNTARFTLACLIALLIQSCFIVTVQAAGNGQLISWFDSYDAIRRQAQLSPSERTEADTLLSKGLSIMTAGPDKDAAHILLQKMVSNYQIATNAMAALPTLPETEQLRRGYYQYFSTAKGLFGDYLTVQDNFFAQDASGKPVIQSLLERKGQLEQLDAYVHDLDSKTRAQYNIPPYRY